MPLWGFELGELRVRRRAQVDAVRLDAHVLAHRRVRELAEPAAHRRAEGARRRRSLRASLNQGLRSSSSHDQSEHPQGGGGVIDAAEDIFILSRISIIKNCRS